MSPRQGHFTGSSEINVFVIDNMTAKRHLFPSKLNKQAFSLCLLHTPSTQAALFTSEPHSTIRPSFPPTALHSRKHTSVHMTPPHSHTGRRLQACLHSHTHPFLPGLPLHSCSNHPIHVPHYPYVGPPLTCKFICTRAHKCLKTKEGWCSTALGVNTLQRRHFLFNCYYQSFAWELRSPSQSC